MPPTPEPPCAHRFKRSGWKGLRRRWMCVRCGKNTRTIDAVDRMGQRPIHPHMSVAVPGFNTVEAP